jgi:exodeoxyribonuclease-3
MSRLISFNVNGIRAITKRYFIQDMLDLDPDLICLQETKATEDQVRTAVLPLLDTYHLEAHESLRKKGYSGTAVLSKGIPLSVQKGLGIEKHDQEGRVITTEWAQFYLVNVYTPNSSSGLSRLEYRTKEWDLDFLQFIQNLQSKKPVIVCGDLNVAHQAIDLKNPKPNYNKSPGYTQAEIDGISRYIDQGWIDSFRLHHPDQVKYSWWSYRAGARQRNVGWRIDYFLVHSSMVDSIKSAEILNDIHGSDHCPVELELTCSLL